MRAVLSKLLRFRITKDKIDACRGQKELEALHGDVFDFSARL
jgi:hypothetical protein